MIIITCRKVNDSVSGRPSVMQLFFPYSDTRDEFAVLPVDRLIEQLVKKAGFTPAHNAETSYDAAKYESGRM